MSGIFIQDSPTHFTLLQPKNHFCSLLCFYLLGSVTVYIGGGKDDRAAAEKAYRVTIRTFPATIEINERVGEIPYLSFYFSRSRILRDILAVV